MTQPIICIVTAKAQENANAVWEAWGKGPATFSRALTTDTAPTPDSRVTHYLMSDASCTDEDAAIIADFQNGNLPDLPEGGEWGEGDLITEDEAEEAVNATNLQVYTVPTNIDVVTFADGTLASHGLFYVPSEEEELGNGD